MSSGPVAPTGLNHLTSDNKRKRSPLEKCLGYSINGYLAQERKRKGNLLEAPSYSLSQRIPGKLHANLTKVTGEDLISSFISIRLSPALAIQSDISFPPSSFEFSHLRDDLAKGVQCDNK
ncbi:hypothetical protein HAX54_019558 [Datura stramonium]|uniref:Uncharacterized protein n=1 Tax=Datura stramonium TaxID=4076 RepID=A0ABS8UPC4_DATST|nr:hypothetical protein [Datura stramonium]